MLGAALAFRGPRSLRLALGALLVCNPIAVRSAWFGQNDAPSLLLLVLAFAMVSRRRSVGRGGAGGAILLKQFALVGAVPGADDLEDRPRRAEACRSCSAG